MQAHSSFGFMISRGRITLGPLPSCCLSPQLLLHLLHLPDQLLHKCLAAVGAFAGLQQSDHTLHAH